MKTMAAKKKMIMEVMIEKKDKKEKTEDEKGVTEKQKRE